MEKWLEAYSAWPPGNQMIFSIIVTVVSLISLIMTGAWVIQLINSLRSRDVEKKTTPVQAIMDWREEQKRIQEEARYQARLHQQMQEEMEQSPFAKMHAPTSNGNGGFPANPVNQPVEEAPPEPPPERERKHRPLPLLESEENP